MYDERTTKWTKVSSIGLKADVSFVCGASCNRHVYKVKAM
jgi:hypothetical protein